MKPDKITCLYCGVQINRGKYCTDAHRMAYKRKPNIKGEQTRTEPKVEQKSEQDKLTETDQTFYDRNDEIVGKDYYNFNGPLREEKCLHCGKEFKTNMGLLRFCSYAHYKDAIANRV